MLRLRVPYLQTRNQRFNQFKMNSCLLRQKVAVLNIQKLMNNMYAVLTDFQGKTLITVSAGLVSCTRKTSKQTFSTLLSHVIQHLLLYNVQCVILKLTHPILSWQAIIKNTLRKFRIVVIYVQIHLAKAFNGVRLRKARRL